MIADVVADREQVPPAVVEEVVVEVGELATPHGERTQLLDATHGAVHCLSACGEPGDRLQRQRTGDHRRKDRGDLDERMRGLGRERIGPPHRFGITCDMDRPLQLGRERADALEAGVDLCWRGHRIGDECAQLADARGRCMLGEDHERLGETIEDLRAHHLCIREPVETRGERQQMTGEVPAIDGGDVHRPQRLER